jgi:hypothetical protein
MNDEQLDRLRGVLKSGVRDQFDDGFADRVVARWRASRLAPHPAAPLTAVMARQFRVLAPLAAAAVLVFTIVNLRHREPTRGESIVEAIFGLGAGPTPTVLSLDELYGLSDSGRAE